jgi:outer membrane lipoprotein LolB
MRSCSRSSSVWSLEADRNIAGLKHCSAVLLLGLACAACAPLTTKPVPDASARAEAWRRHRTTIAELAVWSLTGRIVVRDAGEGWSGTLRWRQDGDRFQLRLIAPLAQGTWQLAGDAGGVEMSAPKGERRFAADAETLMLEALGWSIPVTGARYWVTGIPDPELDVGRLDLDAEGRLAALEQAGWSVAEIEYVPVGSYQLPKRLKLERESLRVQLAVSWWDLAE